MPSSTTVYIPRSARKPTGGFVFLTVQQLCLLWWAYRTRLIQLRDFRVWFAAQEMVARRCQLAPDQVPDYTATELHGLVGGVGGEHLRASLRRLDAIGLLTWSRTTLTFATAPSDLRGIEDLSGYLTMHQAIVNNHRRVPVPRQAIRLMAGGLKATVIATMLGHLLRCLYYREHRCLSGGWCKASWIADVFGVDLRSVKAARKHLVDIGWLRTFHMPQRVCNRWGTYTLINLSWTRTDRHNADATPAPASLPKTAAASLATPPTVLPPPSAFSTTRLPPLLTEDQEPFQEPQHQQPAFHADMAPPPPPLQHTHPASEELVTGVKKQEPAQTTKPFPHAPMLSDIVHEDLHDTARLLILFGQATTQGLIGHSESARLTFLATAEHARVYGSQNPCGLFAALIRRQCWHYVTDSDEDAASRRLRQHLYGDDPQPRPMPQPVVTASPVLSKDAFIVRELQRELERRGFRGEAFRWVHHEDPTWSRERWDRAIAEVAQAQATWQHAKTCNRLGDLSGLADCLDMGAAETAADDVWA